MDVKVTEYVDICRTYLVKGVKNEDEAIDKIHNCEVEPSEEVVQHSEMESEVMKNG